MEERIGVRWTDLIPARIREILRVASGPQRRNEPCGRWEGDGTTKIRFGAIGLISRYGASCQILRVAPPSQRRGIVVVLLILVLPLELIGCGRELDIKG